MNESVKRYYFSIVKLSCIITLIIYFVSNSEKSLHEISVEWFLLAVAMAAAIGYELDRKRKSFYLGVEISMTILLIVFFKESGNGLFLLPIMVLDAGIFFHLSFVFGLAAFLGIFLNPEHFFIYFIYCLFIIVIYYQNYYIIEKLKKYLKDFEQEEYRLKDSIHFQDSHYKEELEKSSILFENKILEEKARLSQSLHDKLGHSINGSIYQLEACKVLMNQEPEESAKIVQRVIDNLRTSMDEIRSILKREKPDKKRMALLQLIALCEECKKKYGIQAEVSIDGEDTEVSDILWGVILDNTIEAVTNALKYAKCTKISIEISILHKVIRCSITDDGVGCHVMKEGMGIQGMKNRTWKVNGFIDIDIENGFRINMIIPLQEK